MSVKFYFKTHKFNDLLLTVLQFLHCIIYCPILHYISIPLLKIQVIKKCLK